MLKRKSLLLFVSIVAIGLLSYSYIANPQKEESIDRYLMASLNSYHYSPHEIDNNLSEKVFKQYIEYLDFNKKFLIQPDIEELQKYEHSIDEDIANGTFSFFDKSLEMIEKRIAQAEGYYKTILKNPFSFNVNDEIETDVEKTKFAKDTTELKEYWRKYLKYQTLSRLVDMKEEQEKAKEKNDTVKLKPVDTLEKEARAKVLKSTDDWFKRLKRMDRKDRLSTYFNAITAIYDPHTEYYAPKDKENFDIGMSGKLEGIGAQLQEKEGYIKVTNIVPGSASWRQGELKAGDVILKVAQGSDEPVDITDMRLDDAVQLIRGKKGTEVRLTVKKPDGAIMVIPIIRDIVIMEETFAKSVILKQGKKNIGYIKLPSFYADFSGMGGRSCAKDVKIELEKLIAKGVDGVILDLRYNGGGSLSDVVDMTGLFIDKGPIVQVKARTGSPYIMDDKDPSALYNGPLVVMVNASSASASEIMAAAIQDYNRGIIVGTSQSTFGKGTVQRFFDLDDYVNLENNSVKPLGQVKITVQKFYRINGGTTQLKGVIPDIILPDPYYLLDQGEKEQEYPMGWDEISAADYSRLPQKYTIQKLKQKSSERIKKDENFKLLEEAAISLKNRKDNSVTPLNIDKYIAEQKRLEEESKKLEKLNDSIPGLEIVPILGSTPKIEGDTLSVAKEKEWHKSIRKDVYLHETLKIMGDMN